MFIVPAEASIRIDTSLPIYALHRATLGKEAAFIGEFDCTLEVAYWEASDDEYDWEVRSICLDGPSPVYITRHTDPEFWEIVKRSLKAEDKALNERIQDSIAYDIDMGR